MADPKFPPRLTQTVLITGGGTGIGAAVARRMAADGWNVCVAGRRPSRWPAGVGDEASRSPLT